MGVAAGFQGQADYFLAGLVQSLRRDAVGHPAISPRHHATRHVGRGAADQDGRVRLLHRLGRRVDGREVDMPAVELAGFVSPQLFHGGDGFAGVADTLGEFDAEQLGFLPEPAGADAEEETSVAEIVEGGDLLGQQDGVALRHQADARAQLERRGYRRGPAQRDEGINAFVVHLRYHAVGRTGPRRLGAGRYGGMFRHPQ